jgi:apolipoprotein N-acyltransferase
MRWLRPMVGENEPWPVQIAGFISGLLLTLPGIWPVLSPIQLVALVPMILAVRRIQRWTGCLLLGFRIGLAYIVPQVFVLRLPFVISLTLVIYLLLLFIVMVLVSRKLLASGSVWSCLAFGAFLAVLDWTGFTLLPMWGTAQSLSRAWSSYPQIIAFTSVTGITGIIFVLGAVQALGVMVVCSPAAPGWGHPRGRGRHIGIAALVCILSCVVLLDVLIAGEQPIGHMKVGAVGWVHSQVGPGGEGLFAQAIADADAQGVRLVVSPETAFASPAFDGLSRQYRVNFVVGYIDCKGPQNLAAFISPSDGVLQRYTKTHLTPFEHYRTGTGQPVLAEINGIPVGMMICQDDNYTDISRRYGTLPTPVLAIPTNDWAAVRHAHLQNTIHRAIESRFAIVRAASNGISAIISAKGQVLAAKDHFREGPGLIVADVPIYGHRTIFSRFGHWFVVVCAVFLVVTRAAGFIRKC